VLEQFKIVLNQIDMMGHGGCERPEISFFNCFSFSPKLGNNLLTCQSIPKGNAIQNNVEPQQGFILDSDPGENT